MKGNKKVIEALNGLLAHEMSAADQYFIHSRMYDDWGMSELFERLKHEQEEELEHAARIVERILFLEGTPDVAARDALKIGKDVPTMLQNDLEYELMVGKELKKVIALCEKEQDYVSRQMLIDLLKDTEDDHTYWLEKQLGLIDKMGLKNYIQSKSS
ncbi:bacterioferritin [Terasakiella brassicae]|uniref:Bacterioferritin n=1 Tax=Terasakiella brassicae TaxID=1634917 RepID=A0A917C0J7_9PROT|nr:bacterioferritin [Terasakiella brassicae]GGF64741.1 bacterioferritin [Terasakiella brassicae]